MSIETALAIFVPLIALCFTAMTFARNKNHDTSESAADRATLVADVRYIRTSVDEIKLENKSIKNDVSSLKERVVKVEASAQSAHDRIDELKKG